MKEFALIFFGLLALCCGYIYSQGGSPFALASKAISASMQYSSLQGGTCDYRCIARQDATIAGVDPDLFERQINQESGFNPSAVSHAGAIGIAQIMPSTAAAWRVDPHDPVQSLAAASNAMAWYVNRYGSYAKALACYNAGCSTLESAMSRCGFYWRGCIPDETQRYISAIMGG